MSVSSQPLGLGAKSRINIGLPVLLGTSGKIGL